MSKTVTIKVEPFVIDTAPGSAQRLVEAINDAFHSGNVCLDFGDIKTIDRTFLNNSLGVTAALHTPQFIKSCLTLKSVSEEINAEVRAILDRRH